jgi:hypothetical protein
MEVLYEGEKIYVEMPSFWKTRRTSKGVIGEMKDRF